MGLIVKLKKNQRIFFGDVMVEIEYGHGQFKLYIDGPNPFPFKIKREDLEDYRKRVCNTYEGDNNNASGLCNLQSLCVSASAW